MSIKQIKKKIINELKDKKEYQVFYKFSDVVEIIKATSIEEAEQIAHEKLSKGYSPEKETDCYEVEAEEL